jgi:hypothetical protein
VTWSWKAVLGALTLTAMAACGAPGPDPSPIPTPVDRVVKIDHSKVPHDVVSYGTVRGTPAYGTSVEDTPELHTTRDIRLLTGAPADFKAYVRHRIDEKRGVVLAELATRSRTVESEDCDFAAEIRVWGVAPHVATGRERGCGQESYDVIWAKQDGTWRLVARMQGGWDCAVLERYRVPADITAAVCWYDVFKTRAYNGPRR